MLFRCSWRPSFDRQALLCSAFHYNQVQTAFGFHRSLFYPPSLWNGDALELPDSTSVSERSSIRRIKMPLNGGIAWQREHSGAAKANCLPQVPHGFGADQREDDVVVLLTLEPVHRRHLRENMPGLHTRATRLRVYRAELFIFYFYFLKRIYWECLRPYALSEIAGARSFIWGGGEGCCRRYRCGREEAYSGFYIAAYLSLHDRLSIMGKHSLFFFFGSS